ncbi:MAG: glycosyltransferase family 2 protein [Saprospiraceae bacterium]
MKVSVIIPVYNAEKFLDKSIQSALNQPQTGEVLLIDDRSTDGSWEICEMWMKKDARVRIFKNEGIKGAGDARNIGLRNASYEIIAFLDADDYFLNGRFEDDCNIFAQNSNIVASANTVEILLNTNESINGLNSIFENHTTIGFKNSYTKVTIYDFYLGSALHLNGLTFKKNLIINKIKFDEGLKQAQDTDFIFRLLLSGQAMSTDVQKVKAVYNIHRSNTISNIGEATYYRRKAAKIHFHLAIKNRLKIWLVWKFFKDFMEYDYLWYFKRNHPFKKYKKLILLPFFVLRIFSKTDPVYYKDREIHF